MKIEVKEGVTKRWVSGERNDLNGGDKEQMTSFGVGFGRGRKELKGEIEEVTLAGRDNNALTAGVFRQDDRCWRS